jgi:hypothetical protein
MHYSVRPQPTPHVQSTNTHYPPPTTRTQKKPVPVRHRLHPVVKMKYELPRCITVFAPNQHPTSNLPTPTILPPPPTRTQNARPGPTSFAPGRENEKYESPRCITVFAPNQHPTSNLPTPTILPPPRRNATRTQQHPSRSDIVCTRSPPILCTCF